MDSAEIGSRIVKFRKSVGLLAKDLACGIGVSESKMSRIESGEQPLKAAELRSIATFLGISPVAILDPTSLLARFPVSARSTANRVPVLRERLQSLVRLHDVLQASGISNPEWPTPVDVSASGWLEGSKRLALWAREVLATGDETLTFEVLADAITKRLGIDVTVEPVPDSSELGASVTAREFPLIYVNSTQARSRALFTLAHELGHVLMSDGQEFFVDEKMGSDDDRERFANAFAAEFLVPEARLRAAMSQEQWSWDAVATALINFQVSFETFIYRLHNLHIINAQQRDTLTSLRLSGLLANVQDLTIKAEVLRLRQNLDLRIPPTVLIARMLDGYQTGVVSARPIASLLDVSAEEVAEVLDAEPGNEEAPSLAWRASGQRESNERVFSGQPV